MKAFIKLVVSLLSSMYFAFCLSLMYNWIVVFQYDVKPISLAAAFGLATMAAMFRDKNVPEDKLEFGVRIFVNATINSCLLLAAYLAHLAM